MMRFFQKTRRNLLKSNKLIDYLIYAIGEIIIIAIGVWLAVYLNNWNDSRNKAKELDNIYTLIAEDLKQDSAAISDILFALQEKKNTFDKILNDSLTRIDTAAIKDASSMLITIRLLRIGTRGYNLLRDFNSNSNSKNDSLSLKIINFYERHILLTQKLEDILYNDMIKITDRWKNKPWFANTKIGIEDESFLNYIFSNEFKNLCAFQSGIYYSNYVPALQRFNKERSSALEAISKRLK